nr:hypothetical protein CFP56_61115 [Quercus suber]
MDLSLVVVLKKYNIVFCISKIHGHSDEQNNKTDLVASTLYIILVPKPKRLICSTTYYPTTQKHNPTC